MTRDAPTNNSICKRFNTCRSTNFLINLKKYKGYICISLCTILIISINIYLAGLSYNSNNIM